MNYSYNAVKFTDLKSFNKNKLKKNVKAYYEEENIIVFKDRKDITHNKTKVSHAYPMWDIDKGVPIDKAIMRASDMSEALNYCARENIKVAKQHDKTGVLIVHLPKHTDFNDFHNKAVGSGVFHSVQQDILVKVQQCGIDYSYSEQWQLPALRVQEAWDLIAQSPPAQKNIICVMDWGCDTDHPDLAGQTIDNLNLVTGGSNVLPLDPTIDKHGTSCTGQIVALNNGLDTTGVSPYYTQVSFVYIFSSAPGYTSQPASRFVDGIQHAIDQPECVAVSCSFGGGSYIQSWQDAVTDALLYGRGGNKATNTLGLGTLVLAAAGNGPCNGGCAAPPNRNILPGSYDGVMSITAVAYNGGDYKRANWPDWGYKLFAAAPGQQTPGTDIHGVNGYTTYNTTLFGGTSSATPITAGVVALVAASNPGLSGNGIKEAIQLTCNKIGPYNYDAIPGEPGKALETGWGMVDAYAAVVYATSGEIDPGPGVTPNLRVVLTGPSRATTGTDYTLTYSLFTNVALSVATTVDVTIFYSTSPLFDASIFVLDTFTVTIPADSFRYQSTYTFTVPFLVTGNYYFGLNATSIPGETYTLDNTAYQSVLVLRPPSPPTGLNLGIDIASIFINPETGYPVISYQFQNVGADTINNLRYRKGFVGRATFEYEVVKPILSEEYLIFDTLWEDVPPMADWDSVLYRIEILTVNNETVDDSSGDNIAEAKIDPGLPVPTYL